MLLEVGPGGDSGMPGGKWKSSSPAKLKRLGQMLKRARDAKGWNLQHAERQTGVGAALIGLIEQGEQKRPHAENLAALCRAVDFPVTQAFTLAGYSELLQVISPSRTTVLFEHETLSLEEARALRQMLVILRETQGR